MHSFRHDTPPKKIKMLIRFSALESQNKKILPCSLITVNRLHVKKKLPRLYAFLPRRPKHLSYPYISTYKSPPSIAGFIQIFAPRPLIFLAKKPDLHYNASPACSKKNKNQRNTTPLMRILVLVTNIIPKARIARWNKKPPLPPDEQASH